MPKKTQQLPFDKYTLYHKAVQSPDTDVEFFARAYKESRKGRTPQILREDFCAAGALSVSWVKAGPKRQAYGVDIDPEPMEYGRANYISKLKPDQKKRVHLIEQNVLAAGLPKADISVACNFSYFIFKQRSELKNYFHNVYKHLKPDGIAIFDTFGGGQCYDAIEDVARHKGFMYYWDQTGFDPVSNEALFHIHFRKGSKKYKNVFTYDWRMWSIPELRDILEEVGFKKTHIYWEGTTRKGEGNGKFTRVTKGEACLSWIAYIIAEK